jgi:hypothetical protein
MIELTLGAIAAALIAKALDRAEEKAVDEGEGALRSLVGLVRSKLTDSSQDGPNALERVKDAPDSPSRIEDLAHLLDRQVGDEPEFRRELEALVEKAKGTGADVGAIAQAAYGEGNIQVGIASNSTISSSYSGRDSGRRTRRVAE